MSRNAYPTRCPLCNCIINYNNKSNGAPFLMCSNKSCGWRDWTAPDAVMDDYPPYISDEDYDLIDKFNNLEDD